MSIAATVHEMTDCMLILLYLTLGVFALSHSLWSTVRAFTLARIGTPAQAPDVLLARCEKESQRHARNVCVGLALLLCTAIANSVAMALGWGPPHGARGAVALGFGYGSAEAVLLRFGIVGLYSGAFAMFSFIENQKALARIGLLLLLGPTLGIPTPIAHANDLSQRRKQAIASLGFVIFVIMVVLVVLVLLSRL